MAQTEVIVQLYHLRHQQEVKQRLQQNLISQKYCLRPSLKTSGFHLSELEQLSVVYFVETALYVAAPED